MMTPEETIAIDESNTKTIEQTYKYVNRGGKEGVLICIVNPICSNYFNRQRGRDFFELFNSCRNYKPFSRAEWCISIFLKFDKNGEHTCCYRTDQVVCIKRMDFLQAEKIFYDLNDSNCKSEEWAELRLTILKLHEYSNILKAKRLGHSLNNLTLNQTNENFNVWPIVHEFSLYANQKFGEYIYNNIENLHFIPLVLSYYEKTGEKTVKLQNFLKENTLLNQQSRFGTEKIHFAKTNKLLSPNFHHQELNNAKNICLFEGAFEIVVTLIQNISNALDEKKFHLAKAWFEELRILALKEELYPEFSYHSRMQ